MIQGPQWQLTTLEPLASQERLAHLVWKYSQKDNIWLTLYLSHSFLSKEFGYRGKRLVNFTPCSQIQLANQLQSAILVENVSFHDYSLLLIISYRAIFLIFFSYQSLPSFLSVPFFFFFQPSFLSFLSLFFFPFFFLFFLFNLFPFLLLFLFPLSVRVVIFSRSSHCEVLCQS